MDEAEARMMEISDYFVGTADVLTLDMRCDTLCLPGHVKIGGFTGGPQAIKDDSIAFHELAHFIEADDNMVTLPDFGLPDGGKLAKTQRFFDKEVETFAIQTVMENQSGRVWKDRHWESYRDMGDFIDYTTRFCDPIESARFIEAKVAEWSIEKVLLELRRKVSALRALPRG